LGIPYILKSQNIPSQGQQVGAGFLARMLTTEIKHTEIIDGCNGGGGTDYDIRFR
jgi:hypothetical protein